MTKFLALFKVEIRNAINLNKLKGNKDSSNLKKIMTSFGFLLISVGIILYIAMYAWILAQSGMYEILLPTGFVMCCLLNLFTTIYKAIGTLFNGKDFDLLMSMPIGTRVVVAAKISMLYIMDLIFILMAMIPIYFIYVQYVGFDFMTLLYFVLTLFIIPIVPLIIGLFIGFVITFVSQRFKHANVVNIIVTFVAFIALYAYIFSSNEFESESSAGFASLMNQMIVVLNQYYPLTGLYVNSVLNHSIVDFIMFAGISIAVFGVALSIVSSQYVKMNILARTQSTKGNYKMRALKTKSATKALYFKEVKKYFTSTSYVINTGIGCVISLFFSIGIAFFPPEQYRVLLENPEAVSVLVLMAPYFICFFLVLCCTTATSISNEAQQLWLIKSMPVDVKDLYKAKIGLNLSLTVPTALISGLCLVIALKPTVMDGLIMVVLPICIVICQAIVGLLFNVIFPKYDWTTEIQLYKRSLSVFVVMFGSMIVIGGCVIAVLFIGPKDGLTNIVASLIFLIISFISWKILANKQIKNAE